MARFLRLRRRRFDVEVIPLYAHRLPPHIVEVVVTGLCSTCCEDRPDLSMPCPYCGEVE